MTIILGLLLALLFGGMLTFQLLFAPTLFTQLPLDTARTFIRRFFPFYYLFFMALTTIALVLAWLTETNTAKWLLSACLIGFIVARQYLMPAANRASDCQNKGLFNFYHRLTVIINTGQLAAISYLLYCQLVT